MDRLNPQSAKDYDDRTTKAVESVLVEIGQILGGFRGKFAIVGGAAPWLLLRDSDMPHIGAIDVDLSLDAEALADGEYARLVEEIMKHGYIRREDLRRFQLVRTVAARDGGGDIDVIVDFLMPGGAKTAKNNPALINDFAAQRADGAELARMFYDMVDIDGEMPGGGKNKVSIAVASIPAVLAMKGRALNNRHKQKDAYDSYYCVRNFSGGPERLAAATKPLLKNKIARKGYGLIADKFRSVDDFGPTCARNFVGGSEILDGRSAEQWQMDAYGQVSAWLARLGLK